MKVLTHQLNQLETLASEALKSTDVIELKLETLIHAIMKEVRTIHQEGGGNFTDSLRHRKIDSLPWDLPFSQYLSKVEDGKAD